MRSVCRRGTVAAMCLALSLMAAPAWAHVTLRVDNPAPEAFAKYTVRVPNESDEASTTKVEVRLPDGFAEARVQPLPGWDISIDGTTLTIEGGEIGPGEFQEFSFSAQNPAAEGDVEFPAIQTYDDGEVVRWVGAADSDQPAPVVTVVGEAGGHAAEDEATEASVHESAATELAAAVPDSGGKPSTALSTALSIVALVVAAAALLRTFRRT